MPNPRPYFEDHDVTLWQGDAAETLRELPAQSVNCIVTSPPYFGLRDYGSEGQIGLEPSPFGYVTALCDVFAQAWGVLADDGVLWLNIGDSYSRNPGKGAAGSGNKGNRASEAARAQRASSGVGCGVPEKNLLGIPWRVAFALQDDGWTLRNAAIWHKPNAMPESVTDRLSARYEHVFLFSKSRKYWFDLDAIKVPTTGLLPGNSPAGQTAYGAAGGTANSSRRFGGNPGSTLLELHETRNPGDVWSITTQPFPGAHFATMPPELARRCILAGCPTDGVVLDPFAGSGTTLMVARQLGRKSVGIDLSADYLDIAVKRIGDTPFDFAEVPGV